MTFYIGREYIFFITRKIDNARYLCYDQSNYRGPRERRGVEKCSVHYCVKNGLTGHSRIETRVSVIKKKPEVSKEFPRNVLTPRTEKAEIQYKCILQNEWVNAPNDFEFVF